MKKFYLLFLVSGFFFLTTPTPVHAFNLFDFLFPPVKMKQSLRSPPGPGLAPEVPSDDTFSNTLKDKVINCVGSAIISKTWEPVKKDTGTTDANGNRIFTYVDYDAEGPIESLIDVKHLSNDFFRNFQLFFARGGIKCTPEAAKTDFTNFKAEGTSASLRSNPTKQILYHRSMFLTEVARSLDQKNPIDTIAQDYQIAWSCSGSCMEFSKNAPSDSCRPVYATEIIFGLSSEEIYYSTPQSDPTLFPGDILANIQDYYSGSCSGPYGCYSTRSKGKPFVPLSKDLYFLFYRQLNFVSKGNANNKITITNYNNYDQATSQPTDPEDYTYNRTLPNASASTSKEVWALNLVSPTHQENLKNTSLCDDVRSVPLISIDKPPPLTLYLFLKGIFKHVPAGESYTLSQKIDITSTYDAQIVPNVQTAEKVFSNIIPTAKNTNLEEDFSTITSLNQNMPIPDPGYRADLLYRQMRSLLRPSSWK